MRLSTGFVFFLEITMMWLMKYISYTYVFVLNKLLDHINVPQTTASKVM